MAEDVALKKTPRDGFSLRMPVTLAELHSDG
jgi:hypothetical protein